jgi:hypothetical protein
MANRHMMLVCPTCKEEFPKLEDWSDLPRKEMPYFWLMRRMGWDWYVRDPSSLTQNLMEWVNWHNTCQPGTFPAEHFVIECGD